MDIGALTVSLTVKDIHASMAFYQKLGFTQRSGNIEQNWVVLKNGDSVIGLFQGMFEKNMLTFVPGWNQDGKEVNPFSDVRVIQKDLKAKGLTLTAEADESTTGPAYFTLDDPDGNPILFDQYR